MGEKKIELEREEVCHKRRWRRKGCDGDRGRDESEKGKGRRKQKGTLEITMKGKEKRQRRKRRRIRGDIYIIAASVSQCDVGYVHTAPKYLGRHKNANSSVSSHRV